MIRVLLLDDHASTRMGVNVILGNAGGIEIAGECATGEAAVAAIPQLRPDILLCDLYLPGLSGLEVIGQVQRMESPPRIVVLSAQSEGPLPRRLLASGVSGYVCKGGLPSELVRCIRTVAEGGRYLDASVAQHLAMESIAPPSTSPFDRLTDRELEVLLHVLRGKRVQEISRTLCVSHKTVSTHKLNAMTKLGATSLPEAMRLALQYAMLDPIGLGA